MMAIKKYGSLLLTCCLLMACNDRVKKPDAEDVVKVVSNFNAKTETKMERKQKINEFFIAYQALYTSSLASEKADTKATSAAFTDCFIEASPLGVICGKNGKEFEEKVEQGFAFYRSIGTQSMHIINSDITLLDEYHAMVKVHWRAGVVKKNLEEVMIDFDVIYFLQDLDDKLRIFAYIAEDEQKAYQEHGIEPYR